MLHQPGSSHLYSYFLPLTLFYPFLSVPAPDLILPAGHKRMLLLPLRKPTPSVSMCLESLTAPRLLCVGLVGTGW